MALDARIKPRRDDPGLEQPEFESGKWRNFGEHGAPNRSGAALLAARKNPALRPGFRSD